MKRTVYMYQEVSDSPNYMIGMRNGQSGFMAIGPGATTSYPTISWK